MADVRGQSIIRGESWVLAFGKETAFATPLSSSYVVGCLGVVQGATIPDAPAEWTPVYALGQNSKRNFYITYRGRVQLVGSIPDVWLLNGSPKPKSRDRFSRLLDHN